MLLSGVNFFFPKNGVKILLILITEAFGIPLNFVPTHFSPHPAKESENDARIGPETEFRVWKKLSQERRDQHL